jgi:N-acetyl-anhydromuramyl-L-alanine amidase AmpD
MYFRTPPLTIIDLPADANHRGGKRLVGDIEFIFIHSTEGTDSRDWLTVNPNSKGASAHRLIRRARGEHYKLMDDLTIANAQGFGTIGNYAPNRFPNLNTKGLAIELERYKTQLYTDWQYEECIRLCGEWWGLYGPLPILSHRVVDPTRRSDPVMFDWTRFKRGLLAYVAPLIVAQGVA